MNGKRIATVALLLIASVPSWAARDLKPRLVGRWTVVSITSGVITGRMLETDETVLEFLADGKGRRLIRRDARREEHKFEWTLEDGKLTIRAEADKEGEETAVAFFDEMLLLIREPDENVLLRRLAPGGTASDR